jgi:hypothetical protein
MNKTLFKEKLNYIFLKDKQKSYTVLKEFNALDFYFSFMLNCMKIKKGTKNFIFPYIGNNSGKKYYFKFNQKNNTDFAFPNFDLTILLEKFNVEDLVKVFTCMLMEFKVILIFDNYEDINNIIWSLIHLLFPLKWRMHVITFITNSMTEYLEAPLPILIGCHTTFEKIISEKIANKSISEDTIIYNIKNKNFLYVPV